MQHWRYPDEEALPGGSHVARLNFKTSHVSVYKCLSFIVSFAVTVTIWPREVVTCRDFILQAVATFWAMSLVGVYPGRASMRSLLSQFIDHLQPAGFFLLVVSIMAHCWLGSSVYRQHRGASPPPPPSSHTLTHKKRGRERTLGKTLINKIKPIMKLSLKYITVL